MQLATQRCVSCLPSSTLTHATVVCCADTRNTTINRRCSIACGTDRGREKGERASPRLASARKLTIDRQRRVRRRAHRRHETLCRRSHKRSHKRRRDVIFAHQCRSWSAPALRPQVLQKPEPEKGGFTRKTWGVFTSRTARALGKRRYASKLHIDIHLLSLDE